MSGRLTSDHSPQGFPRTRWSLVLAATRRNLSESKEAMEAICRAYWHPLYAYARRRGHSPHDAQDLTQAFFLRFLEKRWLDAADPERGRLRTYLVVAMRNFMAKEWRRASAQRRGGGLSHVPLDTEFAESRYAAIPTAPLEAEDLFDRQWALTLLDLTLGRLRAEYAAAGRKDDFDVLKACLMAARGATHYAALATELGVTEGAARVAAHRLRKRFRQVYREEIAQTLSEDTDVDAEMRHLAGVLARA